MRAPIHTDRFGVTHIHAPVSQAPCSLEQRIRAACEQYGLSTKGAIAREAHDLVSNHPRIRADVAVAFLLDTRAPEVDAGSEITVSA